ncbi:hypothetical protein ACTVZO_24480 [Streptomyces sp. IBSNAI002]|uniref:hypothetical protein n=1 Tax=Streptomyces sp. IBSNAI002 TaxID=3457500 RepID=UPI003FD131C3
MPKPTPAGAPKEPAVKGTGPDGPSGTTAPAPEGSASRSSRATAARLASSTSGAGSQPGVSRAPSRASATACGVGRSAAVLARQASISSRSRPAGTAPSSGGSCTTL